MSEQRDYGDESGELAATPADIDDDEQLPGDAIERLKAEVVRLRIAYRDALRQVSQLGSERDRLRAECDRRAIMVAWTAAAPLDWADASEALGIPWQYPVDDALRRRAEMIYAVAAEGAVLVRRAKEARS